ncbi:MAG: competence protein CoiA family protein [Candidatus Odinarchaeota archaeon]
MKELSLVSTPAESGIHKVLKTLLCQKLCEDNDNIIEKSLEKYFGNRFADIYLKLNNNKEIVIEVQNSKISVNELKNRTKDYNDKGIYVLWILHGQGNCVVSQKSPKDEKEIKISPAESFLHKIYGGRVYYINLVHNKKNMSVSIPFALHFTKLLNKRKRGMFRFRYTTFFYRSSNYMVIPSWKLLCTEFSGVKITRFYDKNIKILLKEEVLSYMDHHSKSTIKSKKLLKSIVKNFNKKYGKFMILNVLIELYNNNKIKFDYKLINKIRKKIS